MRRLLIILQVVLLGCIAIANAERSVTDSLMDELEKALSERNIYENKKENRILGYRQRLRTITNSRERFDVLGELYEEYYPFNTDSAYAISVRQEAIGRKLGDRALILNAQLHKANILCSTGMFTETIAITDSIDGDEVPDYLRPYWFHTLRTVYGRLADHAAFGPERSMYEQLTDRYRDSLLAVNDPKGPFYALIKADKLNYMGRPEEALNMLNHYIGNHDLSEHDRAMFAWTMSESYCKTGDRENQKKQLLTSAISDMKSAVREYASLRQLAILLYEEGDLDRAYRFLTIAIDDASKCNARHRIIELSNAYPKINGIYVNTVQGQKKKLAITTVVISALLAIVVVLLLFLLRQMKKLNVANLQLHQSNESLACANLSIAEHSELKEVYIGRYMDQCLEYIGKLDSFRKAASKLFAGGKTDELKKMLKSTEIVDEELKMFYDRFDKTFLNLFPTFVEDFNSLLQEGEEILPRKEGSLTPELRVYALIRLGITDSDKIAKFLHYSISTIYNYRTKTRNKARGDRAGLDSAVQKIARTR